MTSSTTTPRPDISVPFEARERGPIMWGELRNEHSRYPDMLVQFSKLFPKSRKGRIYLYPTAEQARQLFAAPPPFSFTGSFLTQDTVQEFWEATGIWMNSGSEIRYKEALFLTSPWGTIEDLTVTSRSLDSQRREAPSGWYVVDACFLFEILANHDADEEARAKEFDFPVRSFSLTLSDGSSAEIRKFLTSHKPGPLKETTRRGFSINVKAQQDADDAKKDIEALTILASFASRERTALRHWFVADGNDSTQQHWTFNIPKFERRQRGLEPLVPRDHAECASFLAQALKVYRNALYPEVLDAAIYALLPDKLTLEVKIVRLVSGIQSALVFALQERMSGLTVGQQYDKFIAKFSPDFSDLWPLAGNGSSLAKIRNAAVHGEVFDQSDWKALSYAAENLHWILERIILLSLGWDFRKSAVSPAALQRFNAYHWKAEQQSLKLWPE